MLAAALMILGLAFLVFFMFSMMKNARGISSNPITNVINSLTGKGQTFTSPQGTGKGSVTLRNVGSQTQTTVSERVNPEGITPANRLKVSGSGSSNAGITTGTHAPVTLKKQKKDCSKEPNMLSKGYCELQNLFA